ncbi:MAG TPA: DUF2207 domain-containing protein [Frankiaceae bacterium]|nr:DUF2207 domain-containing protein [Frankiaceae bacterium]
MRTHPRRAARLLATLALLGLAGVPAPAAAQPSGERIRSYEVEIDVLPSGRLRVVETIDYSFGSQQKHGIYRYVPVRFRYDDENDRVYPFENVKVTGSPGTPVDTKVSTEGNNKVIRIGDPDRTISGDHRYVITYDVDGALNRFESHDELFWNAIGADWGVPIARVSVTVRAAARIGEVACYAGPQASRLACGAANATGTTATFTHERLFIYSGLTVVVELPAGYAAKPGPLLDERWSAAKAFERSPLALALGLAVLLFGLGAVARLAWRTGRDRRYAGLIPGLEPAAGTAVPEEPSPMFGRGATSVEFAPGADMRPALMGVLLDESADPLDVTATIVDLAVRRYLTIEELPRSGLFRRRDWVLRYLGGPAEGLLAWESKLLWSLFPGGRTEVKVSDLKNEFHTHLKEIQEALYEDVVARGWFSRRPDKERGRWFGVGVGTVIATAVLTYLLARFTRLGLVGVAAVVPALVLLALHKRMPFRTGRGTAALDRARGFERYLATAETNQLKFEEQEGIFARYLPYAVVLGETERWARAFGDLGAKAQQELYWYSGPSGFSTGDFTDSVSSFSTMTAGTIASTPGSSGGSGFGGGGSVGGGGGGGGGGSW